MILDQVEVELCMIKLDVGCPMHVIEVVCSRERWKGCVYEFKFSVVSPF